MSTDTYTHTCELCGAVVVLTSHNMEDLPQQYWSYLTDDLCEPCWFDEFVGPDIFGLAE